MQLSTNKNKNKKKIFNTRLAKFFLFFVVVEIRAFTVMVLKILAFSISKSYFIYFTTSFYNTLNIKCFFFLSLHLK